MGIKSFFKWVRENFSESCRPVSDLTESTSHHVYIDVNGLLHGLIHDNADMQHEEQLFSRLFSKLDSILRMLKPTRTVYLTLDGAPPQAKLYTMRNRRRKRCRDPEASTSESEPAFGANLITPGLPFMSRLEQALEYYVADRMREGHILGMLELECAVSGSGGPGEGEMKALRQLLRMGAGGFGGDRHVVVSSDADAILSTLAQSSVSNVLVLRLARGDQQGVCWSRERFVMGLSKMFQSCDEEVLRRELVLLTLLAGNDFLPGLCDLQTIWTIYKDLRPMWNGKSMLDLVKQKKPPRCFEEGGWCHQMGDTGAGLNGGVWGFAKPADTFFELLRIYVDKVERGGRAVANQDAKAQCYIQGLMWQLQSFMTGQVLDYTFCYPWATERINAANLCTLDSQLSFTSLSSPTPPMRTITAALLVIPMAEARVHFPHIAVDGLQREALRGVDFLAVDIEAVGKVVNASAATKDPKEFKPDVHLYYQHGSSIDIVMPKFPSLPLQFGARQVYPSFTFTGQRFVGFWPKATARTLHNTSSSSNRSINSGVPPQTGKRQSDNGHGSRRHKLYKPSFFNNPWRSLMN